MPLISSRINQVKERNRLLNIRTKSAYQKIDLELATKKYTYLRGLRRYHTDGVTMLDVYDIVTTSKHL